jgi:aryl-alcohol dehydrogenase-like predicted oxidoreductase
LITGASKPSQLKNNLKAIDLTIPDDYFERVDQLFHFKKFERKIG